MLDVRHVLSFDELQKCLDGGFADGVHGLSDGGQVREAHDGGVIVADDAEICGRTLALPCRVTKDAECHDVGAADDRCVPAGEQSAACSCTAFAGVLGGDDIVVLVESEIREGPDLGDCRVVATLASGESDTGVAERSQVLHRD